MDQNSNIRICCRHKCGSENIPCPIISVRYRDCNQFQASKTYNVHRQISELYLKKNRLLSRRSEIGIEVENNLKKYLFLFQECGFGFTTHEQRVLVFNFKEKSRVTHRFNRTMVPQTFRPQGRELPIKSAVGAS